MREHKSFNVPFQLVTIKQISQKIKHSFLGYVIRKMDIFNKEDIFMLRKKT